MQSAINLWAIILVGISVMIFAALFRFRRYFFLRIGEPGFIILVGYTATLLVPSSAWALGLSSAFNDPNNPLVIGTGGYYGVNPRYFPPAALIYISLPLAAIVLSMLFPRRPRGFGMTTAFTDIGKTLKLERVGYVALFGAVMLNLWYFYTVGFDRFWYSNLSRFEFEINVSQNVGLKIVLTFILAFGCLGAALSVFEGLFLASTCVVVISSFPFLAFASRGISVLVVAYCGALFFRMKTRARVLLALPMLALIFFSLRVPLIMRDRDQTGIQVAFESIEPIFMDASGSWLDDMTSSLLNVGQGFGLIIEERELENSGRNITEGIPDMYFLLSLSPTISAIDGFSENWLDYHPRQNLYTPYSGICEIMAKSVPGGILLLSFVYFVSIVACRAVKPKSLWQEAGLFSFSLVIVLGFLQLQQYPLRTGMRFIYAAFALLLFFQVVAFLAATSLAGKPIARLSALLLRRRATAQSRMEASAAKMHER